MSEHYSGWFIDSAILEHPALTPREKLVMGVVFSLHKKNGCTCSNRYIAEKIGMTANAVRQSLVALRKKGFLAPSEAQFPKEIMGPRLVPLIPPVLLAATKSATPPLQNQPGGATKSDTDRKYTLTIQRETPILLVKTISDPRWSDQRTPEIIRAAIQGTGYSEAKAEDAFKQLRLEREVSGSLRTVENIPLLLRRTLEAKDRAAVKASIYTTKQPASQFSVCH